MSNVMDRVMDGLIFTIWTNIVIGRANPVIYCFLWTVICQNLDIVRNLLSWRIEWVMDFWLYNKFWKGEYDLLFALSLRVESLNMPNVLFHKQFLFKLVVNMLFSYRLFCNKKKKSASGVQDFSKLLGNSVTYFSVA